MKRESGLPSLLISSVRETLALVGMSSNKTVMLGVCYYPEHWPEDMWASDAQRMRDLGLTYVRIGEFAWGRLEKARASSHGNGWTAPLIH